MHDVDVTPAKLTAEAKLVTKACYRGRVRRQVMKAGYGGRLCWLVNQTQIVWSRWATLYAFAPFGLIQRVLGKLERIKERGFS